MARTVRDAALETRAARMRLKPRAANEPYWRAIEAGRHLGYRRGARGSVWLARMLVGGKYLKAVLSNADDVLDADGLQILNYGQAQSRARAWFAQEAKRAAGAEISQAKTPGGLYTVEDAARDYTEAYRRRGGRALAGLKATIDAHIVPTLGKAVIAELTTARLRHWHQHIAESPPRRRIAAGATRKAQPAPADPEEIRRRRNSANRVLTTLRAILNFAFVEENAPSDLAWRRVRAFRGADAPVIRRLSLDQCAALIEAAEPIEFRNLVRAAILTGARYGELARLRVVDLDARTATLAIRLSKAGPPRHVALTDEGVKFLSGLAKGKPGDALLLPSPDGAAWMKSRQHRFMRAACSAAGIEPPVGIHIARHSYASLLAEAGVPLQAISRQLGHSSSRMSERHYAHIAPNFVAQVVRSAFPTIGVKRKKRRRDHKPTQN